MFRRASSLTGIKVGNIKGAGSTIKRPEASTRRLAKASAGALLFAVAIVAGTMLLFHGPENKTYGILDNCLDPLPKPGPARPWESQIQVSTYSAANTAHRNLFTAIPIVSWSGTGPDMNMMLYHNAANVGKPVSWTDNTGINLGPGWTIAYSDQLILDLSNNNVTVVQDDGTEDVFNYENGAWVAPAGVYDILTQVDSTTWWVTHKNQWFHEFKTVGAVTRLNRAVDATGNETTLTYTSTSPNRLSKVRASGRDLNFVYNSGQLSQIVDPVEAVEPQCEGAPSISQRVSTFTYTSGRVTKISDEIGKEIDISYVSYTHAPTNTTVWRLATMTDKHDAGTPTAPYTFTYLNVNTVNALDGGLQTAKDPLDANDPQHRAGSLAEHRLRRSRVPDLLHGSPWACLELFVQPRPAGRPLSGRKSESVVRADGRGVDGHRIQRKSQRDRVQRRIRTWMDGHV